MNTWGISGPTFLVIFVALLVALALGYLVRRGRVDGRGRGASGAADDLDPYDVALLNGGDQLAVLAAATQLRQQELVALGADGRLGVEQRPHEAGARPGAGGLERAVLEALGRTGRTTASSLRRDQEVDNELVARRERLVGRGLMASEADRAGLRVVVLLVLPVLALGVARLVAGLNNDKPVGYLITLLLVGGMGAVFAWHDIPRATRQGRAVVQSMRSSAPGVDDSADALRTPQAALAVAVFGGTMLWRGDPAFASALSVPRETALGWAGGAGGAGAGAGGGGGGGGGGGCGG